MKFLFKKSFCFILLGFFISTLSFAELNIEVEGVLVKFYNKPSKEELNQVKKVLKQTGLKQTESSDIAQFFVWSRTKVKAFSLGKEACKKAAALKFVRRCFIVASKNQCYREGGLKICQKLFDSSKQPFSSFQKRRAYKREN